MLASPEEVPSLVSPHLTVKSCVISPVAPHHLVIACSSVNTLMFRGVLGFPTPRTCRKVAHPWSWDLHAITPWILEVGFFFSLPKEYSSYLSSLTGVFVFIDPDCRQGPFYSLDGITHVCSAL